MRCGTSKRNGTVSREAPMGTLQEIPCGVALGIQRNLDSLLNKISDEVEAGYQRIKLKIKPGHDVAIVKQVRRVFPDTALMVDGNSSYRLTDAAVFQQLDDFELRMIEQPLWWDGILDIMPNCRPSCEPPSASTNRCVTCTLHGKRSN